MKNLALVIVVVLGTFFMFLPAANAWADNTERIEAVDNNDGDPEKKCEKCKGKCTDENCTAKCKKDCKKADCKKECSKDASCSKENCKKGSCKKSCTKSANANGAATSEKSSDDEKC